MATTMMLKASLASYLELSANVGSVRRAPGAEFQTRLLRTG